MASIALQVDASAVAVALPYDTSTRSQTTGLSARTSCVASPAMARIVLCIHASGRTLGLSRRAAYRTLSCCTDLSCFASSSASAAVRAGALQIKTATRTSALSCWATDDAFSCVAQFACFASIPASAAVTVVGLKIHAISCAGALGLRAGDLAFSALTALALLADRPTNAAMIVVRLKIAAFSAAIGLSRWAGTRAVDTVFSRSTGVSALSTMLGVFFEVDTVSIAKSLGATTDRNTRTGFADRSCCARHRSAWIGGSTTSHPRKPQPRHAQPKEASVCHEIISFFWDIGVVCWKKIHGYFFWGGGRWGRGKAVGGVCAGGVWVGGDCGGGKVER